MRVFVDNQDTGRNVRTRIRENVVLVDASALANAIDGLFFFKLSKPDTPGMVLQYGKRIAFAAAGFDTAFASSGKVNMDAPLNLFARTLQVLRLRVRAGGPHGFAIPRNNGDYAGINSGDTVFMGFRNYIDKRTTIGPYPGDDVRDGTYYLRTKAPRRRDLFRPGAAVHQRRGGLIKNGSCLKRPENPFAGFPAV